MAQHGLKHDIEKMAIQLPLLGTDIDTCDEHTLDIEIFPDRPDLLSGETLAKAIDREVETASALTQKNNVLAGSGTEPYVIGLAFSLDVNKPSALVQGNDGVYMVEVTSKEVAAEVESYTAYANALQVEESLRINNTIYEALRSASEIEDNRKIYY